MVIIMICNTQSDYGNDLFCIEKKHKDGFYYEVRSRNIVSGRFYGIRFEGKKKFYFFVFDSGRWNVYLFRSDAVYHPASFRDVHDLTNLETDILNKKIVPIIHIKSGKSGSCFLRRGGKIELPEMPFFYPSELRMLDRQTEIERYKYTDAPKYLITARLNKYVKPQSPQSLYMFGCNKDSVYKQISAGCPIEVTDTDKNLRAVAVRKTENIFNIIPKQHCLRPIQQ